MDSPDHIAHVNPFRYRGYYYDAETGFYWLQSRYYDPEVGRFLNSDSSLGANQDLQSYNMFAYCSNNPINYSDPTGQWKMPNWLKVTIGVGVIAGLTAATALTCGTVGAVSGYKSGGWSGATTGFMTGTISGAASGALSGSGVGYITQAICGGLINATSGVVISTENMKKVQVKSLAVDFAGDFAVGAISGLIGGRGILNKKESFSAAMNTFDHIAAREIRRKNAIYSAKIIKSAMYDYQHAWIKNCIISGARYGSSVAFVEIYDAVAGG